MTRLKRLKPRREVVNILQTYCVFTDVFGIEVERGFRLFVVSVMTQSLQNSPQTIVWWQVKITSCRTFEKHLKIEGLSHEHREYNILSSSHD